MKNISFERKCARGSILTRMKRMLVTILALVPLVLGAQTLSLSGFSEVGPASAAKGVLTDITDLDGRPCAVVRIETDESWLTFEAGLAGIMDVSRGDKEWYIYIPAQARTLTIAHPRYAPVRDWTFPEALRPGRLYSVKLEVTRPRTYTSPSPYAAEKPRREQSTSAPRPAPAPSIPSYASPKPSAASVRNISAGDWCNHFVDVWLGSTIEDWEFYCPWVGMRYTWIGHHFGAYLSAGISDDEDTSIFAGAAWRPFPDNGPAPLDLQLYGGAGLVSGYLPAFELGLRFGWESSFSKVSLWDFGFGLQFFDGYVMPTVEVGLCIWGIPVALALCVVAEAI